MRELRTKKKTSGTHTAIWRAFQKMGCSNVLNSGNDSLSPLLHKETAVKLVGIISV